MELLSQLNNVWLFFGLIVLTLLCLDLGIFNKKDHTIGIKESLYTSLFYISVGLLFPLSFYWIYPQNEVSQAMQLYWTGFIVEKSLSMDNIFVISLIMSYFAIKPEHQHKVLFWGILGAIVLRGVMISLGSAIVEEYHWVLYLFSAFLLYTGVKLVFASDDDDVDFNKSKVVRYVTKLLPFSNCVDSGKFVINTVKDGVIKKVFTPLFLALIVVELMDLIFALDSIPAIFSITTDPKIVFTSNIFAILGLRALFFALQAILARFEKMKIYIALVLVFIGSKIFLVKLLSLEHFPTSLSLGITLGLLTVGGIHSFIATKGK